jgi:hypothetical protein
LLGTFAPVDCTLMLAHELADASEGAKFRKSMSRREV